MNKFFSYLLLEKPEDFNNKHPKDQHSILLYGMALMLILIIEFTAGLLNAKNIFKLDENFALMAAFVWMTIIYLIDLIIIKSPSSKWIQFCRLLIGLIIAIIGTLTVDSFIFKKEIEYQLKENEKNKIMNMYLPQINKQEIIVQDLREKWNKLSLLAIEEADGKGSSSIFGAGRVYQAKKLASDEVMYELNIAKKDLNILRNDQDQKLKEALDSSIQNAGFLTHVRAHFQFIFSDKLAMIVGLCFSLLIMSIQLLIVGLKIKIGDSVEKQLIEAKADSLIYAIKNKKLIETSKVGGLAKLFEDANAR